MTPQEQAAYDRGYEAGMRDYREGLEPGEGSRADVQAVGSIADHGHTAEQESAWWLGYYHAKSYMRAEADD